MAITSPLPQNMENHFFGRPQSAWNTPFKQLEGTLQRSHWSRKNRSFSLFAPKSASSSLVVMLMKNDGISLGAGENPTHLPFKQQNLALTKLSNEQCQWILDADADEVFRWCAVRNPYARTVSAWRERIATRRIHSEEILATNPILQADDIIPFEVFLRWLTSENRNCEEHFASLTNALHPQIINYHLVIKTEQIEQGLSVLQQKIKAISGNDFDISLVPKNTTISNWKAFYNQETADLVYDFYQKDFANFDYGRDSWRPGADDNTHSCKNENDFYHWIRRKNCEIDANKMIQEKQHQSLKFAIKLTLKLLTKKTAKKVIPNFLKPWLRSIYKQVIAISKK